MKELNIEKLKLARAARIKVRENIQEAFSAVEQLQNSIIKFSWNYHQEAMDICEYIANIEDCLNDDNDNNSDMIHLIDSYLEQKYCTDNEIALLEKEVKHLIMLNYEVLCCINDWKSYQVHPDCVVKR